MKKSTPTTDGGREALERTLRTLRQNPHLSERDRALAQPVSAPPASAHPDEITVTIRMEGDGDKREAVNRWFAQRGTPDRVLAWAFDGQSTHAASAPSAATDAVEAAIAKIIRPEAFEKTPEDDLCDREFVNWPYEREKATKKAKAIIDYLSTPSPAPVAPGGAEPGVTDEVTEDENEINDRWAAELPGYPG